MFILETTKMRHIDAVFLCRDRINTFMVGVLKTIQTSCGTQPNFFELTDAQRNTNVPIIHIFVPLQCTKAIRKSTLKHLWDICIYCIKTYVPVCGFFTKYGKNDFSAYCINSLAENICSAQKQHISLKMKHYETVRAETERYQPIRPDMNGYRS